MGKKINNFIESNQSTYCKSSSHSLLKSKNISLDKYIGQIKNQYKENPIFFESINKGNNKYHYLFSFCFNCQNPVVAYDDKVVCINGCYKLDVETEQFNDNYTLDKFLDEFREFSSDHLLCNGDIIPVYIDKEAEYTFFLCTKCDQEILSESGIIL